MKVLFWNLSNIGRKGGDTVWCRSIMQALGQIGVESDFSDDPACEINGYDLVHVIHCQWVGCVEVMKRALEYGIPYVISAIFYPEIDRQPKPFLLKGASAVIVNSATERAEFVSRTQCNPDIVHVIPHGVDKTIFYPAKQLGTGVISLGFFDYAKGFHHTLDACERLGLPLTTASLRHDDTTYADIVRSRSTETYEGLSSAEVAELLRRHRVLVTATHSDRMSMVVLEAAACGLNIVDSIHNRGAGFLRRSVVVNPEDAEALDRAIVKQYARDIQNMDFVPSWTDIAQKVRRIYANV